MGFHVETNYEPGLLLNQVHTLDVLEGFGRINSESVQLIFADPPYNLGFKYGAGVNDQRPHLEYMEWCAEWFKEVARVLADGGSFYVMHYPEICAEWKPILDSMLEFRRWITWTYPTNVGHSRKNWTRTQRTILFFTKGDGYTFNGLADAQPYRNPHDRRIQARKQLGVVPYDVWDYNLVKNVSREKTPWPNQIPVALVERIIKTSSNAGDVVLDPFMGSGTTAVAAIRNNRSWLGFDLNPNSSTVTEQRIGNLLCAKGES